MPVIDRRVHLLDQDGNSINSGNPLPVTLVGSSVTVTADTEFPTASALNDSDPNPTTTRVGSNALLWDNVNSVWVRERTNDVGTLFSLAARTGTQFSSTQTNLFYRGVMIGFRISSVGTGALNCLLQVEEPAGGAFVQYSPVYNNTTNPFRMSLTGTYLFVWYPGCPIAQEVPSAGPAGLRASYPLALPRSWRWRVGPDDGSSWTYSCSFQYIR